MKYRTKSIVKEATQWFKDGDHPAVETRRAEIIFDRAGHYFYVSHFDQSLTRPDHWLAVDPAEDVAQRNGDSLPFAFYEVNSGGRVPVTEHPELLDRYMASMQWSQSPADVGYIETLEGGHIVSPGDWIITGVKGEHYPCKPDVFERTYEPIEQKSAA